MGHDVFLVSMEKGGIADVVLQPIGPFKALHYYLAKKQLSSIIENFKPDLISAHYASGYGFLSSLVYKKYKIPIVLSLWGSDILVVPNKSFLHKWKTIKALKSAKIVIGDSDFLLEQANNIVELKNKKRIFWGIEEKYLSFHKKEYSISTPLKIIVSRHQERVYNNSFIVKTLKDLINGEKVEITFPSFGSLIKRFRIHSKKLVDDNINYYDKMPREEFIKLMVQHDVYLSASKSDSSPVSLIEAMGLGLIPIVANHPGIFDLINSERFIFEQDNSESLIRIIKMIISSKNDFAGIRNKNLQFVKENAIFKSSMEQHIDIFRSIVN